MHEVEAIIQKCPEDWRRFCDGESLSVYTSQLYEHLYNFYLAEGEMPLGVAKARTGDPDEWIATKLERFLP